MNKKEQAEKFIKRFGIKAAKQRQKDKPDLHMERLLESFHFVFDCWGGIAEARKSAEYHKKIGNNYVSQRMFFEINSVEKCL